MVPVLEELCEVGVAVNICNDFEIKQIIFSISEDEQFLINNCKYSEEVEIWHSSILKSLARIAAHFPSWLLREGIKNYIPLVAREMLKWSKFHEENFGLSRDFCKEFIDNSIFKTNGSIDRENAARALLEETSLSLLCRVRIACYYSFPVMIAKLLMLLKESDINSLSSNGSNLFLKPIVKSWTTRFFDTRENLVGTKKFMFNTLKISIDCGSDVSFGYFWKQLEKKKKEQAAKSFMLAFLQETKTWKGKEKCLKLQYLYDSYINVYQHIVENLDNQKVFQLLYELQFPHEMLVSMLNWPYQSLFLKSVNLVWDLLPDRTLYLLVIEILEKMCHSFVSKVYDYRLLFRKLWIGSRSSFKRFIYRSEFLNCFFYKKCYHISEILIKLFSKNFTEDDEKLLRLILESATEEELNYLLRNCFKKVLVKTFEKGLYNFADVFLKCCKVEDVKDFKSDLLVSYDLDTGLKYLFQKSNYHTIDKVFEWIVGSKGLAVIKLKIRIVISDNLNFYRRNLVLSIKSDDNELGTDLLYNFDTIVQCLHSFLIEKKEDKINEYVEWICARKEQIKLIRDGIYKNYSNKNHQYYM